MGLLEDLRQNLNNYTENLASERNKIASYQVEVNAIDAIYKDMKNKKKDMSTQKKEVQSFSNKDYENWKGNLFSTKYKKIVQDELVGESYEKIITEIDANLDALRDKRTSIENKILSSKGIIGSLEAGINSLSNSISKLLN